MWCHLLSWPLATDSQEDLLKGKGSWFPPILLLTLIIPILCNAGMVMGKLLVNIFMLTSRSLEAGKFPTSLCKLRWLFGWFSPSGERSAQVKLCLHSFCAVPPCWRVQPIPPAQAMAHCSMPGAMVSLTWKFYLWKDKEKHTRLLKEFFLIQSLYHHLGSI